MEPSLILVMTLIHACIAILTTGVNIYVVHRRTVTSSTKDARRLRTSLIAELGILKATYNNNVAAVYEERSVIISGRAAIAVYRGGVGRLSILDESEIPAVVAAYAFCEAIEGFLSAHGRTNGQSSYSMGKDRDYANELIALYHRGAELTDQAVLAMSGGKPRVGKAVPAPTSEEQKAAAPRAIAA